MRTIDLDVLKPEGYEITFEGKTYKLEALTVEQVIKGWPKFTGFQEAAEDIGPIEDKTDAEILTTPAFKRMIELAKDFAEIAIPDFPEDATSKMTPDQLTAFMGALTDILSTEGEEGPKAKAE